MDNIFLSARAGFTLSSFAPLRLRSVSGKRISAAIPGAKVHPVNNILPDHIHQRHLFGSSDNQPKDAKKLSITLYTD